MRTPLPSIALLLAFGIACGHAASSTTNSVTNLATRLRALSEDKAHSYQRLLRDATHETRRVALDQPWSNVESALRRQGLRRLFARDNQHTSDYRYLIAKDGWVAADGTAHSLFVEFSVDRRSTKTVASAKPGYIMVAAAGLFAEPDLPYSQVLTNRAYPEGSVLFRGLRLPEATTAARSYPILKKIEVTYDFIRDHNSEIVPQGFGFRLTFGDSARDEQRGRSLFFTADSGLDPLEDWHGKPLQQQFKPQDTVGEFRAWGSNEWKQTD